MSIQITDVREYLDSISDQLVGDPVVQKNIDFAEALVDFEKAADADAENVKKAKVALAGFLSYNSYATFVERGTGTIPPPVLANLEIYKNTSDTFREMIKAKMAPKIRLSVTETISNRWQRFRYNYV